MFLSFENKLLYDNKFEASYLKMYEPEKRYLFMFYSCFSQLAVFSFYLSENHMPLVLTILQSESTCLKQAINEGCQWLSLSSPHIRMFSVALTFLKKFFCGVSIKCGDFLVNVTPQDTPSY